MYKSKPYGPTAVNYYPPLKKFGILLRKLRFLGIYHDEHLVCNRPFQPIASFSKFTKNLLV